MHLLTDLDNIDELISQKEICVVQFGSNSCSPCESIKQKLNIALSNKDEINYIYVDIEKFNELAATYSIFSVPTILVFVQSKLTIRESGYFSLESILKRIDRYLELLN